MKNNKKITRHPEDLDSVEEFFTPMFIDKYHEFRRKTKILIFVGFILKYLAVVIIWVFGSSFEIVSILICLVGFWIYFNGCASFAKLKGYRRFIGGILAFCDVLGLIILFILPDKPNKHEIFIKDLFNASDEGKNNL